MKFALIFALVAATQAIRLDQMILGDEEGDKPAER